MNKLSLYLAMSAVGILCTQIAVADISTSRGEIEFRNSCATCHGPDGKAGMSVVDILKVAPPSLVVLSKNNGGVFPEERVAAVIDGREIIKGHGNRDMPIWGARYSKDKVKVAEYYLDMPYDDTEQFVQSKITSLIDYLKSIQEN